MTKGSGIKLSAIAALLAVSSSASAAVVNGVFTIDNATITDLFSTTLDSGGVIPNPSCTGTSGPALQECQFFGGVPSAGRLIQITHNGYGLGLQNGTLDVQYDDMTGEITAVNVLRIYAQDLTINIAAAPLLGFSSPTVVSIVNGNGIGLPSGPFAPPGPVADDQTRILGGIPGVNGTADADQGVAVGQASIFQHNDTGVTDAPDFSTFLNVVDSCAPIGGGACSLLGLLTLDAQRYRLEGTINPLGGFSMVLKAQTGNSSIYTTNFSVAAVPAPPAVWLLLTGVGALVARRFRSR